MSISIFGFQALWSPYFFFFVSVITAVYFLLIGPFRNRFKNSEPATLKQKLLFLISMILLYLFKGGPLDLLGHLMFSAHMTQMAVVYLVIPPLLILGTPAWLLRLVVNQPIIRPLMKFFTKPLIAIFVFNGLFSLYHMPLIFDVVKTDMFLHALTTIVIFLAAFIMWWPLVNPLEEWQTLSGIKKIGYIFANGILLTPACALIIFAETPLYATYTDPQAWANALQLCVPAGTLSSLDLIGPQMFNSMPLLEDQRTGGVIMKIIQEIVYGAILSYVFFQWVRKEREQDELEEKALLLNPYPSE
ncbi:cytochrome c oxidase assembly factor CtaG [Cytobacillus sp. S13-E01]|uniref:cytochrome c oxidase assembly factor CtaG n=1 Tax=Cytobacillus sp. S13-E01 TaxID=3031326 RepID=UPI0023D88B75|nr:cytochrome c oxidase assembly factor CtaG [Cytobacillus sp. S13-E01]MDF0725320.1 cytochrome c oxidase assembly factor CtaG [Cytobacillus sp. S13-E01]